MCDAPAQSQQVNQTGEVIAFVINGPMVEAHIQIQYNPETEASKFAWIIPVQQVPSFRVGSDPLFQNLLASTVPTYILNSSFETCGTGFDSDSATSVEPTTGSPTTTDPTGVTDGDPPPDVVHQETVGAFDVVVLEGGTVDSITTWLTDNGYQQDPEAGPILQEYLDEDYKFVAFKLTQSVGIDAIHPVVLEYEGNEACVPIRLTRIAAEEDMEIRAFFLGNNRTVPTNYRHVLINDVKIDWFNLNSVASQYQELVTQAVDAFKADGHAFVTEYAGNSQVVTRDGITSPLWESEVFSGLQVIEAVDTLRDQGILSCLAGQCSYFHPLIESLLTEFIPVPDGLDAGDFYSCLECYPDLIDVDAWGDGSGFAAAYETRIVDPGKRADALLDTWPYLTRMYTTISPGEMTVDPIFHQNPSLANVSNFHSGTQVTMCNGTRRVTVPPGRVVYVPAGFSWPEFAGEMPWTHEVQTAALEGASQVLVDNDPVIEDLLDKWNAQHGPSSTTTGGGTDSDTAGSTTGDSASGSGGQDDEGCGCRNTTPSHGPLAVLAGLALLATTRRKKSP